MSEHQLALESRTLTGKKLKSLRADDLIPSVIYGGKEPILAQSPYNPTEKVLRQVGYHSPLDLTLNGKKHMAITKNIATDPITRKIINVQFQAVSADEVIEAVTPIVVVNFVGSEAHKVHYMFTQSIEEVAIKAKPRDLPKEITLDASALADLDDKLTIADLSIPENVELADKELDPAQVVVSLYDPAVEAAAREVVAEEAEEVDAAAVPSDSSAKPEEPSENAE